MDLITGIVQMVKNVLGFGETSNESQGPVGSTPITIDWSQWSRPGGNDVRSPCPAINALANHNILPHSGKGISKAMAVEALAKAYHLDPKLGSIFAAGAVAANPDHSAHTFDLNHVDKHGYIEHDVSLSRDDAAFGDNTNFSQQMFGEFFRALHENPASETTSSDDKTSWKTASQARYSRVIESKNRHEAAGKQWSYGIKEAVASYGETALYLSLLGKEGVAPLNWIKIFFEEERLPYNEGWRPPPKVDQSMLNHGFFEMLKSYGHGEEEAKLVGMGTFEALKTAVGSLGTSLVKGPTLR